MIKKKKINTIQTIFLWRKMGRLGWIHQQSRSSTEALANTYILFLGESSASLISPCVSFYKLPAFRLFLQSLKVCNMHSEILN